MRSPPGGSVPVMSKSHTIILLAVGRGFHALKLRREAGSTIGRTADRDVIQILRTNWSRARRADSLKWIGGKTIVDSIN
jgi:hypothetical protein